MSVELFLEGNEAVLRAWSAPPDGGFVGDALGVLREVYGALPGDLQLACRTIGGVVLPEPHLSLLPGLVRRLASERSPVVAEGFGGRLRRFREGRGYSQSMLSKLSGVKQSTISNLELGKQVPRGKTVRMLARSLGCRGEDLLA